MEVAMHEGEDNRTTLESDRSLEITIGVACLVVATMIAIFAVLRITDPIYWYVLIGVAGMCALVGASIFASGVRS